MNVRVVAIRRELRQVHALPERGGAWLAHGLFSQECEWSDPSFFEQGVGVFCTRKQEAPSGTFEALTTCHQSQKHVFLLRVPFVWKPKGKPTFVLQSRDSSSALFARCEASSFPMGQPCELHWI